ncbi:hypothetical protein [Geobacter grbiciae]|uniref:hypothetical protein n=1 Tax=Geobacter grbiciae TaxID=155042 RepID=UPI001C00D78A|nr:hypothetical protein [Geobacter grbiciae]MBT1074038.1 hypothetical protein [Geobacter grbiciae]
MTGISPPVEPLIACQQVLLEDSSVFSIQWLTMPEPGAAGVTPDLLFDRYLAYIRRFTLSLIRPKVTDNGVEFRLLGLPVSLISFASPVRSEEGSGASLSLPVCGGLLVLASQGALSFLVEEAAGGVRLTLRLAHSRPLLLGSAPVSPVRKFLYRFTQAHIHKVVTVRFLARLYWQLTGCTACARVVPVRVCQGEEL